AQCSHENRKSSQQSAATHVDSAGFLEVSRQPCDIEIETVKVAEPLHAQHPQTRGGKIVAPRRTCVFVAAFISGNHSPFGFVRRPMLNRSVSEPPVKRRCPGESDEAEHQKHDSP